MKAVRYLKPNDQTGRWDVIEGDTWLADFESESLAHEFAYIPEVLDSFKALVHLNETPGDFTEKEKADIIADASHFLYQMEKI